MWRAQTVTKEHLSRDEFMSPVGEALIMQAITGQATGDLATGHEGVTAMRNAYDHRAGEPVRRNDPYLNLGTPYGGINTISSDDLYPVDGEPQWGGGLLDPSMPWAGRKSGYIPPAYARRFQEWAKDAVPLLPMIDMFEMASTQTILSRIGLGNRVLHGSHELTAMTDEQKTRLIYGSKEMNTRKYMGQMDLSYEMLEDTIERGNLRSRILRMLGQQVGADQEYIVINSDTRIGPSHPYPDYARHYDLLNKQDGLIKMAHMLLPSGRPGEGKVGSNIIDCGGETIDVPKWYMLEYALPERYRKSNESYLYLTSRIFDLNWREYLTDRPTSVGDTYILKSKGAQALGTDIMTCPQLPHDVEMIGDVVEPGDNGFVFLLAPKNIKLGWWRHIMIETTKDIERQVYKLVISMRLGITLMEPDAISVLVNLGKRAN